MKSTAVSGGTNLPDVAMVVTSLNCPMVDGGVRAGRLRPQMPRVGRRSRSSDLSAKPMAEPCSCRVHGLMEPRSP